MPDVTASHVDRQEAGGLCGVDDEQDSPFAAEAADFCDRLDRADDVRSMVYHDKPGLFPEGIGDALRIDDAILFVGDIVDGDALLLSEMVQGPDDRVVLHHR